jgi:hypothetical protein
MNVDETLTTTDVAPPKPDHNYDLREADAYGYTAAVSEEDQKKGRAAGDVIMFKYAGFSEGAYHLILLGDDGRAIGTAQCPEACIAIKERFTDGSSKRIAFTESSIIGAAFQDAFRGKLVKVHAQHTAPQGNVPSQTYENNIVETDENEG